MSFDWVFPKFSKRPVRRKSCIALPSTAEIPLHLRDASEDEVRRAVLSVPRHYAATTFYLRSDTAATAGSSPPANKPSAWGGAAQYSNAPAISAGIQKALMTSAASAQQTIDVASADNQTTNGVSSQFWPALQYIGPNNMITGTYTSAAWTVGLAGLESSASPVAGLGVQWSAAYSLYLYDSTGAKKTTIRGPTEPSGTGPNRISMSETTCFGTPTLATFTVASGDYLVLEYSLETSDNGAPFVLPAALGNNLYDCGATTISSDNVSTTNARSAIVAPYTLLSSGFQGEDEAAAPDPAPRKSWIVVPALPYLDNEDLRPPGDYEEDRPATLPTTMQQWIWTPVVVMDDHVRPTEFVDDDAAPSVNVTVAPLPPPSVVTDKEDYLSSWFIDDDRAPVVNVAVGVPPPPPPYVSLERDEQVPSAFIDDDQAPSVNAMEGVGPGEIPVVWPIIIYTDDEILPNAKAFYAELEEPPWEAKFQQRPWTPVVFPDEDPWRLSRGLDDERDARDPVAAMTITWTPVVVTEPQERFASNIFDVEEPARAQVVAITWTPVVYADTDENGGLVSVAIDDLGYTPTTVASAWTPVVVTDDETTFLQPLDDEQYTPAIVPQPWTPVVVLDVDELQPTAVVAADDDNAWQPTLLVQPWNNTVAADVDEFSPGLAASLDDDPAYAPQRVAVTWTPVDVLDDEAMESVTVLPVDEEGVPPPQVMVTPWTPVVVTDTEDAWILSTNRGNSGVYVVSVCRGPSRWRGQNFADDLQLEQLISSAFREDDVPVVLPPVTVVWNSPLTHWDEEEYPPPQPLAPDDESVYTQQTVAQAWAAVVYTDPDDRPPHIATTVEDELVAPVAVMASVWTPVVYSDEHALLPTALIPVEEEQGWQAQAQAVAWTPYVATDDEASQSMPAVTDDEPGWWAQTQAVYWSGVVYRDEDGAPQLAFVDDESQVSYPTVTLTWTPAVVRDDDLVTLLPQNDDPTQLPQMMTTPWTPVVIQDEPVVYVVLDQVDGYAPPVMAVTWTPVVFADDDVLASWFTEDDTAFTPRLLVTPWTPVVVIDDEANGSLAYSLEQEDGWTPRYLVAPWFPFVFTDDELNYAKSLNVAKMADVYVNVQVVSGVSSTTAAIADVYSNTQIVSGQVGGGGGG